MSSRTIDLTIGWGPWPDEPFLDMLLAFCSDRGLNVVVCKDRNIKSVLSGVESGRASVGLHLDLQADYEDEEDLYARLGYAVQDAEGMVVNAPDSARACANKAILHHQLERAGVPVPYTILVRNWRPSVFTLSATQRKRLGKRFVVKPARGYGKEGVVFVRTGSVKEIGNARRFDPGDDFLIQEAISPEWFGHRMGWFRVFCLLGETTICWWDTHTQHYSPLTRSQFLENGLAPLAEIARQIAAATTMRFFSTEVAVTGKASERRFLSIDYVNDPCDTTLQSHSHSGLPDVLVSHMAEAFAEAAWRVARGHRIVPGHSIWYLE